MALSKPLPHLKLHDIKNSSDTLDLYIQYLNASNTTVIHGDVRNLENFSEDEVTKKFLKEFGIY